MQGYGEFTITLLMGSTFLWRALRDNIDETILLPLISVDGRGGFSETLY